MTAQVLTTNTQSIDTTVHNFSCGQVVADAGSAADQKFYLGFKPRYVKFVNATDRIIDEWFEGMAAASSIHTVAAGTVTLETTNGVTVVGAGLPTDTASINLDSAGVSRPSGGVIGNYFMMKAATMVASKTFYWVAMG